MKKRLLCLLLAALGTVGAAEETATLAQRMAYARHAYHQHKNSLTTLQRLHARLGKGSRDNASLQELIRLKHRYHQLRDRIYDREVRAGRMTRWGRTWRQHRPEIITVAALLAALTFGGGYAARALTHESAGQKPDDPPVDTVTNRAIVGEPPLEDDDEDNTSSLDTLKKQHTQQAAARKKHPMEDPAIRALATKEAFKEVLAGNNAELAAQIGLDEEERKSINAYLKKEKEAAALVNDVRKITPEKLVQYQQLKQEAARLKSGYLHADINNTGYRRGFSGHYDESISSVTVPESLRHHREINALLSFLSTGNMGKEQRTKAVLDWREKHLKAVKEYADKVEALYDYLRTQEVAKQWDDSHEAAYKKQREDAFALLGKDILHAGGADIIDEMGYHIAQYRHYIKEKSHTSKTGTGGNHE